MCGTWALPSHTAAAVPWSSPPSCHKPGCLSWVPPPRSDSSISCLNGHPFENAGLSCFCKVFNSDSSPSMQLAPPLGGFWVPKEPQFLMLLVFYLPKCHLGRLALSLHCAQPQEPLPPQGCSALLHPAILPKPLFSPQNLLPLQVPLIPQEASPAPPAPHLPLFALKMLVSAFIALRCFFGPY